MRREDKRVFLWIGALLLGGAVLAAVVLPQATQKYSTTETAREIDRRLALAERSVYDRPAEIGELAQYIAGRPQADLAALEQALIDRISYFVLDADDKTKRAAMNALVALGSAGRPAAERALTILKSEPETRIDPVVAWSVELKLTGKPMPVGARVKRMVAEMKGASQDRKGALAGRILALMRMHRLYGRDVITDDVVDDVANLLIEPGSRVQHAAASALATLGPRASRARSILERVRAQEKARMPDFCVDMCGDLLDAYDDALSCISMSATEFELASSVGVPDMCHWGRRPD